MYRTEQTMNPELMTLVEALAYGTKVLSEAGIKEADLDAWCLLEFVTGIDCTMYFADRDRLLTKEQAEAYRECIGKRSGRIPLQHLTGEQEFMGLTFHVNEHVLVPRQDTEVLVEEALRDVRPGTRVLDMCTGSGCILLSLIWHGNMKNGLPCGKVTDELWKRFAITGVGVDISPDALLVAEENRRRLFGENAVRTGNCEKEEIPEAKFVQSDLFEKIEERFDMIVSNPPYIRTAVIETLEEEVRCHDPFLALDGKEDGLYFYRRIIEESPAHLKAGGRLLFEIGHDQAKDVSELMKCAGFTKIRVKKDLAGLDRVLSGVYNG